MFAGGEFAESDWVSIVAGKSALRMRRKDNSGVFEVSVEKVIVEMIEIEFVAVVVESVIVAAPVFGSTELVAVMSILATGKKMYSVVLFVIWP